jgi:hypothetical protein
MTNHKGGMRFFSKASDGAKAKKSKLYINRRLSRSLGISEAALNESSPSKPGEDEAQKIQATVRGALARTKRNKINASLAASTLKRSLGIAPSITIKKFLAGKKRKSRKSKKSNKKK